MPTILPIYSSEVLSDKNFIKISTYITELMDLSSDSNSSIDERTPRIIFKIKKYYVICV